MYVMKHTRQLRLYPRDRETDRPVIASYLLFQYSITLPHNHNAN